MTGDLYVKRNMIIQLLISQDKNENQYLAYLLYDLFTLYYLIYVQYATYTDLYNLSSRVKQ